jgi:hypothetical protein
VFVETPDYAGLGDTYEHPPKSQLDYNNPITTIYHIDSSRARLYFGTKDGQVGKIKQSKKYLFGVIKRSVKFVPVSTDSNIHKIIVNYHRKHISGLKFYSGDKCVLEAGRQDYN